MKVNFVYLTFLMSVMANAQQNEIQLYKGLPPGSEIWTWKEGMNNRNSLGVMTVYNVVHPTLTAYLPDPKIANGTAIVIAPGGGFHFLAIDHEGTNAAQWLVKKGITVFVLKYRLVHISGDNPFDDMLHAPNPKAWDDESLTIIPLAVADGRAAIAYVREHADEYKISKDRIGFMGFSAGGRVTAGISFGYDNDNRPNFIVPVYADMPESEQGNVLPDAPPAFIVCAQDDEFGFAMHAIRLYNKWYAAKRPVEMHLFSSGGHGFGVGSPANTTHNWIDRLIEWLIVQELIHPK